MDPKFNAELIKKAFKALPLIFFEGSLGKIHPIPKVQGEAKRAYSKTGQDAYQKFMTAFFNHLGGDIISAGKQIDADPKKVAEKVEALLREIMLTDKNVLDSLGKKEYMYFATNALLDFVRTWHLYVQISESDIEEPLAAVNCGNYTAMDMSNIPMSGGLYDSSTTNGKEAISALDVCTSHSERNIWAAKYGRAGVVGMQEHRRSGKRLSTNAQLALGHSKVAVRCDEVISSKEGGKTRALVVNSTHTHVFQRTAMHLLIVLPNGKAYHVVVGFGVSNAPLMDPANTLAAGRMWSLVKKITAERFNFQEGQRKGTIDRDLKWEEFFAENFPGLFFQLFALNVVMGAGERVGIWWNQFCGVYDYNAMSKDQYVKMREIFRTRENGIDWEKVVWYATDGQKESAADGKDVKFSEAKGGVEFELPSTQVKCPYDFVLEFLPAAATMGALDDDEEARGKVDNLVRTRMAELLGPMQHKHIDYVSETTAQFFKKHPEYKVASPGEIEEALYRETGIPEKILSDVQGAYDKVKDQMTDDLYKDFKSKRPELQKADISTSLEQSFLANIANPYVSADGPFLQDVIQYKTADLALSISEETKIQLEHTITQLATQSAVLEDRLRQADPSKIAHATAEKRKEFEGLKKEKEKHDILVNDKGKELNHVTKQIQDMQDVKRDLQDNRGEVDFSAKFKQPFP